MYLTFPWLFFGYGPVVMNLLQRAHILLLEILWEQFSPPFITWFSPRSMCSIYKNIAKNFWWPSINGMVTVWYIAGLCLVLGPGLHPVVEPSLPNPPPPILAAGHKPQTTWPTVHQCWQQLISTASINSVIENNYQQLVISLIVPC